MKTLSKWIGLSCLILIALAPFAYFFDQISFSLMTGALFVATVVWFASAFFWIGKPDVVDMDNDPLL